LSKKSPTLPLESVDALRRRVEELERWFQTHDRQVRFLERERQKLSALVNHTDAGFVVFDPSLHVRWLNNVCRTWFGGMQSAHGGHAATRPELPPEPIGVGASLQESRQASTLLVGQPAACTGRWSVVEGFCATLAATRHPLADRPLADTQGRGDLALRPTPLCEGPGLSASSFLPVVR